MKTSSRKRLPLSLAGLLLALLLNGCGEKNAPKGASADAGISPPPFFLFVTDNDGRTSELDSKSEVELLKRHRAVLACQKLVPGRIYEVKWRLLDPSGKAFQLEKSTSVFKPDESLWYIWVDFTPPERPPRAGKWLWEASVKDGPMLHREFTMLEPSKDELDQLARQEAAREAVFNAFAQRWLGHDEYFFTLAKGGLGLIEVAGLGYKFEMEYVSAADKLNGIAYKGKAQFSFDAYRSLLNKTGPWTPWKDTQEFNNSLEAFYAEQFKRKVPEAFEKGFNLQYTVIQQDGHWNVLSDSKLRFVDQRLVEEEDESPVLPSREVVQQVLNEADSPRKKALREGQDARKAPRESGSDLKKTMDMLRGRKL